MKILFVIYIISVEFNFIENKEITNGPTTCKISSKPPVIVKSFLRQNITYRTYRPDITIPTPRPWSKFIPKQTLLISNPDHHRGGRAWPNILFILLSLMPLSYLAPVQIYRPFINPTIEV